VSMLQAYPNLKGIESPTTVGISSAAQYLSTSKYKKKVALTGLGLPSQMKKYVHDGTVKAFALWNPEDLGYLAGYAASALADGTITGKVGEKFKGEFAILSAASTATNQNAWIKYMKLELKKPAYKNMKLVKIYYGNDNPAQSRQATVAMLQAYPNLKGIESPTTVGISSAAQYLSTSKYKKKVVITGLGLPSQMKKYVHDGTVTAFALWNPEDLGYLAGYAVSALADGTITGKVGETFKAGKLGSYKIINGPDKRPQVILGPPYTFTIKNVDKFNF